MLQVLKMGKVVVKHSYQREIGCYDVIVFIVHTKT